MVYMNATPKTKTGLEIFTARRARRLREEMLACQAAMDADLAMTTVLSNMRRTHPACAGNDVFAAEVDDRIREIQERRRELDRTLTDVETELNQILRPNEA